ncbi:MAG: L-threonylcarbamoyladenylate synthase [Treponema sp.]|nr:L-threonylcarbamoyladenylate synthase [Treponema sp.]
MICRRSDKKSIKLCVDSLLKGEVVILPTDTVYGFSAAVKIPGTDAKIRKIKGREETKPFIQLIARPKDVFLYTDDKIPRKILNYWPGPLTVIVNNKDKSQQLTTAFRCPGDRWLRKIIRKCGCPVYSTSVNRSGQKILDTENAIIEEFSNEADLIVLDGEKKEALPSTIIKIVDDQIEVIRKGAVEID